jgi:hypothetical protein
MAMSASDSASQRFNNLHSGLSRTRLNGGTRDGIAKPAIMVSIIRRGLAGKSH